MKKFKVSSILFNSVLSNSPELYGILRILKCDQMHNSLQNWVKLGQIILPLNTEGTVPQNFDICFSFVFNQFSRFFKVKIADHCICNPITFVLDGNCKFWGKVPSVILFSSIYKKPH